MSIHDYAPGAVIAALEAERAAMRERLLRAEAKAADAEQLRATNRDLAESLIKAMDGWRSELDAATQATNELRNIAERLGFDLPARWTTGDVYAPVSSIVKEVEAIQRERAKTTEQVDAEVREWFAERRVLRRMLQAAERRFNRLRKWAGRLYSCPALDDRYPNLRRNFTPPRAAGTSPMFRVPDRVRTSFDERRDAILSAHAANPDPIGPCPNPGHDPWAAECLACGERDCPHGEPLHYHHDGCPACTCVNCGEDHAKGECKGRPSAGETP